MIQALISNFDASQWFKIERTTSIISGAFPLFGINHNTAYVGVFITNTHLQCNRFYIPLPVLDTADTWQSVNQYKPQSYPVSHWVVLEVVSPYACSSSRVKQSCYYTLLQEFTSVNFDKHSLPVSNKLSSPSHSVFSTIVNGYTCTNTKLSVCILHAITHLGFAVECLMGGLEDGSYSRQKAAV